MAGLLQKEIILLQIVELWYPLRNKMSCAYKKHGALSAMYFQQEVEQKAFAAGGGKFVAPAQRLIDFCEDKMSSIITRMFLFARN